MNKLKITLNEDGSVKQFIPDFKIIRGSYRNVLLNIEVPHSLLVDPVKQEENNVTGNNVRVGAIIRTSTGHNLQTKRYELQWVKDYVYDGKAYSLYQRQMPKEFTLWETVNEVEATNSGALELVINVVNWTKNELDAKIEEVSASPVFRLDVYPSAFLENAEEIEEPSDFDNLHSQVQELQKDCDNLGKDLYGEDGESLGTYLSKRLKAGYKIILGEEDGQIKISLEKMKAKEVDVEPITDLKANNVQDALKELSERTDNKFVSTVTGIESSMVDNTDPHNPVIQHDKSKIDKSSIADNLTTDDRNQVLAASQGVVIKGKLDALDKAIKDETNNRTEKESDLQSKLDTETQERKSADTNLQGQIDTLSSSKANKTDVTKEIADAINAIKDSAPEAFDTLKEIADWIEEDKTGTSALISRVAEIEQKNNEQDEALSTETKNRESADSTLQDNIDAETKSRESKDTELEKKIDEEIKAREEQSNTLNASKLDDVVLEGGTENGTMKLTKKVGEQSSSIDNIKITGLKGAAFKEASEFASAEQGAKADSALQEETDPHVPSWAKQPDKPTYTAEEVGALPKGTAYVSSVNGESGAISGLATEEYVTKAIDTAIGLAMGGSY